MVGGTRKRSLLRNYATNRRVAGSSSDKVDFFQFPWSFQPHYSPRVDSASKEMSISNLPGGKGRPARKVDTFTAICESIVYSIDVSQPYGPP
jgi:hypothetical protein